MLEMRRSDAFRFGAAGPIRIYENKKSGDKWQPGVSRSGNPYAKSLTLRCFSKAVAVPTIF